MQQGAELVVIKGLLGHTHTGVTSTVHAHVRLRFQCQAIDLLRHTLSGYAQLSAETDDGDDPPVCAAPVR
ncbi:hypothetical protein [Streptomyces sp. NPDC002690]